LLNTDQNVEGCDARKVDSSNNAEFIKLIFIDKAII